MAGETFAALLNEAVRKAVASQESSDLVFGTKVSGGIKLETGVTIPKDFYDVSKTLVRVLNHLEDSIKSGDKLAMVRYAKGQRFYVIDKVD